MNMFVIRLNGEDETIDFARRFGSIIEEGTVVGLVGDLGAGKTTFVKGLADGMELGTDVAVTSPTFALANVYGKTRKLAHIDLYRITSAQDVYGAGIEDFFFPPYSAAVEWFEKLAEAGCQPPPRFIEIRFEFETEETFKRRLLIFTNDDAYALKLNEICYSPQ